MNKKIGSSLLAAAAFTGLMSGLAFADDTKAGADAAPAADTGKKAKKSKGKHTCKATKSSCKSKSGCKAGDAKTDAAK